MSGNIKNCFEQNLLETVVTLRKLSAKHEDFDENVVKDCYNACRSLIGGSRESEDGEAFQGLGDALLGLLCRSSALAIEGHMLVATALSHVVSSNRLRSLVRLQGLVVDPDDKGLFLLCLSHGIVCSVDQLQRRMSTKELADLLLQPVHDILAKECIQFSYRTSLAFKVLVVWLQKIAKLNLAMDAVSWRSLMLIVSASWEIPVSGVRENNSRALEKLLDMVDAGLIAGETKEQWQSRLENILDEQPWTTKSKYFLLSVLITRTGAISALRSRPWLLDGLLFAVASTHRVSAATDVYHVFLKEMSSEDWCRFFLEPIVDALSMSNDRLMVRNLLNYWILPTMKKIPGSLEDLLSSLMARKAKCWPGSVNWLLSMTFLLKLGRKEALWDIRVDSDADERWDLIHLALSHADEDVRAAAFSAVCISGKTYQPLTDKEIDSAKMFLTDNVNVDSSALRRAMLNSFSWLLMRIKNYASQQISKDINANSIDLRRCGEFLIWLHRFLLDNLEPGSNYQRRITSLMLYLMTVRYLEDADKCSKGIYTRKGVTKNNKSIFESEVIRDSFRFASEESCRTLLCCLTDPTDDVRETAGSILKEMSALNRGQHVGSESGMIPSFGVLWSHALKLCSSSLFYEAESGALLIHVLSTWAPHCSERGENVDLLEECSSQLEALRKDVLAAAAEGNPLHGVLAALGRLLRGRPVDQKVARQIVDISEQSVEYCLSLLARKASDGSEFAPSFAEMGEAIESMLCEEDIDSLTLSPAHQLVLNCIWLNLKVGCTVSSSLVECPGISDEDVERVARILVSVLTRCRHKGAIESAGVSLQGLVSTLTRNRRSNPIIGALPLRLLEEFLQLLLEGRTASGTSVSRRSAGMSILVHRIVSGDEDPKRPLLETCVSRLFRVLEESVSEEMAAESSTRDIPQAQALHFLRTLVADAGLRVGMASYMPKAAVLCFKHLSSPVWSVRNAGLQLFGALVPKLVGQKKATETEEDSSPFSGSGDLALNELALRYPKLLELLLQRLDFRGTSGNVLEQHADLVPTLSLLARLSASETIQNSEQVQSAVKRFQTAFLDLLSSPIATVRFLAATAYSRMVLLKEAETAVKTLTTLRHTTENGRMGAVLAMYCIKNRLRVDGDHLPCTNSRIQNIEAILKHMNDPAEWNRASYLSRALLLELNGLTQKVGVLEVVEEIRQCVANGQTLVAVGVFHWAAKYVEWAINACDQNHLHDLLQDCLRAPSQTDFPRNALSASKKRLLKESYSEENLQKILDIFVTALQTNEVDSIAYQILEQILIILYLCKSTRKEIHSKVSSVVNIFKTYNCSKYGPYCETICVPIAVGLLNFCDELKDRPSIEIKQFIEALAMLMQNYSSPEYQEDFRMNAAKSLRFFGSLRCLRDQSNPNDNFVNVSITVLDTAVCLLQDEDYNIREESSKFVLEQSKKNSGGMIDLNPNCCLQDLMNPDFLRKFLVDNLSVLKYLWKHLTVTEVVLESEKDNLANPFKQETKNIYLEEVKLVDIIGRSCLDVLKNATEEEKAKMWISTKSSFGCLQKWLTNLELTSRKELPLVFQNNVHGPNSHLTMKKIRYQLKFISSLKSEDEDNIIELQKMLESCALSTIRNNFRCE